MEFPMSSLTSRLSGARCAGGWRRTGATRSSSLERRKHESKIYHTPVRRSNCTKSGAWQRFSSSGT